MCNLKDIELRNNLLRILAQYEVYSGQVIVFREAIAIIALLLAGNSEDYVKHQGLPCLWVDEMVSHEKWFTLLSRRTYNSIYNPYKPLGVTKQEIETINNLECIKRDPALKLEEPSNDAGVVRLFGSEGIAEEIHPLKNSRYILNEYDLSFNELRLDPRKKTMITPLEEKAFEAWTKIMNSINEDYNNQIESLFYVKRWATSNIFNLSFFQNGLTRFTPELDTLIDIYSKGSANAALLQKIEMTISGLIGEKQIPISQSAKIEGIEFQIEINTRSSEKTNPGNPYGLLVSLGSDSSQTFIDTRTLCYLIYKSNYGLSSTTFPARLLDQLEMNQLVTARQSKYNVVNKITLRYIDKNNGCSSLNRYKGIISKES